MIVDHSWLFELFLLIFANTTGKKYRRCFEPFAGSASWSLAAMECGLAEEYIINDSDSVLINAHRLMRDDPEAIKEAYSKLTKSYDKSSFKKDFFIESIKDYNKADSYHKSLFLPFIINHSWSGLIFHDLKGNIIYHESNIAGKVIPGYLEKANLSLDMFLKEVDRVSNIFNANKVHFQSGDYLQAINNIQPDDFVALNPPYPENERSVSQKMDRYTGYTELYSPETLHENLAKTIQQMDNKGVEYFMTYGFYNPRMKKFVLYDNNNQIKNYFRVLGYANCAFGMALDQMYFSSKFSLPKELHTKILRAYDVLGNQELTPKEALDSFIRFSERD
jgi:site-specific DNA-adenine methylase